MTPDTPLSAEELARLRDQEFVGAVVNIRPRNMPDDNQIWYPLDRWLATITDLQSRLAKAEALKDAFVKDWSKAETAEIRAIMRAEKAEKALATLLMIATGFDDDDRDYERINNLAGCENNHWRTQLRLFKEGPTIPTHEGGEG